MNQRLGRLLLPLVVVVLLFALWQWLVRLNDVSVLVLPAPTDIVKNVLDHPGAYWHDARITFIEAFYGFALALALSIVLAAAMVHLRILRHTVDPLAIALRCLPVVAIAPGLAIWLGFGMLPKVIVAALITFPPLLINLVSGFRFVDVAMLEVMQSVDASTSETFFKLRLPNAMPYLFSSMKVCTTLALMGAVVGEWSNSSEGLGYRIIRAQKDLATTTVWGAIAVLALMGLVLTLAVTIAERRSLRYLNAD